MVMAYIIFVNPAILSFAGIPALAGQGPPFAAVQAATCLVAGAMTIAMGLVANYPLAVASGMGLNAAVAFQLVAGLKLPWQVAMGVVFIEGLVLTVLVLTGFREAMMNAIPLALKRAIGVGIGLFILFIGLYSAHRQERAAGRPGDVGRDDNGSGGRRHLWPAPDRVVPGPRHQERIADRDRRDDRAGDRREPVDRRRRLSDSRSGRGADVAGRVAPNSPRSGPESTSPSSCASA